MSIASAVFDRLPFHAPRKATPAERANAMATRDHKPRLTPELMDFYKQEGRRLRSDAATRTMLRIGARIARLWHGARSMN